MIHDTQHTLNTHDKAQILLDLYNDRNTESNIDEEIQLHYNLRIAQLKFYLHFGDAEISDNLINSLYNSQLG